jgi:hypothetical protein
MHRSSPSWGAARQWPISILDETHAPRQVRHLGMDPRRHREDRAKGIQNPDRSKLQRRAYRVSPSIHSTRTCVEPAAKDAIVIAGPRCAPQNLERQLRRRIEPSSQGKQGAERLTRS